MKELELDYETRSEADLKRIGPYLYALHPSTEVLCVSWALGDEDPKIWWPTRPKFSTGTLEELVGHLLDEQVTICAHNAGFERCITRFVLSRYCGFSNKSQRLARKLESLSASRFQCSAAQAAAVAIPRSLEGASLVMGLSEQKDMEGNRLVKKYMKPRTSWRKWKATGIGLEPKKYYDDDFELMAIGDYCVQDVKVERLLKKSLPPLTPYERLVWLKNQEMNSHGFSVDTEAVDIIRKLMRKEVKRLEAELVELTEGAITTTGQRDKFIEWLRTRGVEIPNLRAKVVEEFLEDESLEPSAKRALQIRAMISKTSNKKYHVLAERVGPDGRVRDLALYHGASTGRETGMGFQPHNLPRGTIEVSSDYAIDVIKETKDLEEIEFLVGPPFEVFSSSIRGMIKATDGYEIIAADLNAIECRVLNWVAGNEDVLEAFRNNEDPYRKMASRIFGEPMDSITSSQRFLGKTAELGCGYQMGADRFYQTCIEWGVPDVTEDLAKLAVKVYRESHSKVVRAWGLAERAATEAILKKGTTIKVLKCAWHYDGSFLWCQLPSGRRLAYKSPSVRMVKTPWGDSVRKLYYWSVDSKTKKWKEQGSYGGHIVENLCQAIARDVTVSGIMNISKAGYRYLFQCHDEIISEKLAGTGSVKEFVALMTATPPWAKGLPIAAAGWRGPRYKKD